MTNTHSHLISNHLTTNRWLSAIEKAGNKLPHPTALFIFFCLGILLVSAVAALFKLSVMAPGGQTIAAQNLLSQAGLHYFLTHAVTNFVQFAPVGTLLVAILGLGIAEHSGLLPKLLQAIVQKTPPSLLTTAVIFCGVMSSLASDSGYVVLLPLAAILFMQAGRHPIAGIACAFAGVSAGYSANLFVGPLDAILAGLSQEAAKLVDSNYRVGVTSNYYFIVISTLLITLVGSVICQRYTLPQTEHLAFTQPTDPQTLNPSETDNTQTRKALHATGLVFALLCGVMAWGCIPSDGFLRSAEGSFIQSPFLSGIVVIVAITAALCGITYGLVSGRYQHWHDCIAGMEQNIATLSSYLVLMFFAAQFVNLFSWSQLGKIMAIIGAAGLQHINLPLPLLLIAFVLLAAFINLLIGSASAKWALLAPVFVPMFMLLGIAPEATQMAYRIGDSTTNIITPLMPYFGVVIALVQKYNRHLGAGTVVALMLPYSIALLFCWTVLLALWLLFNLPLGPNAYAFLP